MANKIEILVEVDPNGKGAAAIKSINAEVSGVGKNAQAAGGAGADFVSGFAGAVGLPITLAGIAASVLAIGQASLSASRESVKAFGILEADAKLAKISLGEAREQAKQLGDDLALSETQAEKTFAQFLRVVTAAGETKNIDKYRKQFQDLVAQYGLAGQEIETLTSQLLSGQDEALNRLGIADPSQLYAKYAEQVGKTVDALSNEEKARARVLAVVEKGAEFAGAAERRLANEVGQWELLKKSISDSTTALGEYISSFQLYQYLVLQSGRVLKEGYFVAAFSQENIEENRQQDIKNKQRLNIALAEKKRIDEFLQANAVTDNSRFITDPLGALKSSLAPNTEETKKQFIAQYEALFKDKRLSQATLIFAQDQFNNIRGIFSAEKQVELSQGLDKLFKPIVDKTLGVLKRARDAAQNGFGGLADRYAGGDNPFVKVFAEAETNARKLQETFGALGNRATQELRRVEDAYNRQRVLGLQLGAELKANALRREADALSNRSGLSGNDERFLNVFGARIEAATNAASLLARSEAIFNGTTGTRSVSAEEQLQREYAARRGVGFEQLTEEDKFLATRGREKEIERLNKRQASFIDSGLQVNPNKLFEDTYNSLTGLFGEIQKASPEAGQKAKFALSDALVNYFNTLGADLQADIANGGQGASVRNTFGEAFRTAAESYNQRIKDEIAKGAVIDTAIAGLRKDLETIGKLRGEGLDGRKADASLLAVTGALDAKDLPADILQERIEALRREADSEVTAQDEARKALEKSRESTDALTAATEKLAAEIRNPQNRRLLIEINNRAKADVREDLFGGYGEN